MLNDVLSLIAEPAGPAPADTSSVTVALIGLAGLVMSALIAGYFGTRGERRHGNDRAEHEREIEAAEWDAAHAENERRDAERECVRSRARVAALERALYRRRLDPTRVTTGEENDETLAF